MAFNVHVAQKIAGLSLRQVRYWDELGLVRPSVQPARGRGSRRLYSFEDLVELRIIAQLRTSGLSLQKIAKVTRYVRKHLTSSAGRLAMTRLLTDGQAVFVRAEDHARWEDALRGGQVVWFVPVDEAWREAEARVETLSAPRHESVTVGGRSFEIVLEPDLEAGGWVVECPALLGCVSEGDTVPAARRMIREAIAGWLAASESDAPHASGRRANRR